MRIGVDVDGTVVNTSTFLWGNYLAVRYKRTKELLPNDFKYPYNVADLFEVPEDCDAFAFWKDPNLYEGLKPFEHSVSVLQQLKNEGHEIIFISQIKGFHSKSKYYFIDKWFPFKDGVVLTKEKHFVGVDVMIDDTNHVLDSMPENVLTIKFREDTIQPEPKRKHLLAMNWKDVYNICTNKEEKLNEKV